MKIKICGITRLADAEIAVTAGVDLLGFIFYPSSTRAVAPETVRDIICSLPESMEKVGVFVNESPEKIREIARFCGLNRVQLHGQEPPEMLAELAEFSPLKAVAPRELADLSAVADYVPFSLLVDTPCEAHGGSGKVGNWTLAGECARRWPIFLAGGLRPENVAAAITAVQPVGVDVSSGVEAAPGCKDPERIRRFIQEVRQAEGGNV